MGAFPSSGRVHETAEGKERIAAKVRRRYNTSCWIPFFFDVSDSVRSPAACGGAEAGHGRGKISFQLEADEDP